MTSLTTKHRTVADGSMSGRAAAPAATGTETNALEAANYARAILNILGDVGIEQKRQGDSQRAVLNILEDLDTQKNQLESTQRALINMLDDLEAERRKVDRNNIELREVNDTMRGFIATAAHDLRSPLASMVGFSTLLATNWATLNEEMRLKFVMTIDRQSHKLTGLVNDLLTLSSIEGGVLSTQPEQVILADAISQCLAASGIDATTSDDTAGGTDTTGGTDTASVSVCCPPDLLVRVDPSHLGRILENYLQNALKYGAPPVRFDATRIGELVELRVVDHGTGVPPGFETKLFGKFARADLPSMRNQKGTGLGLSIVRGLAEANGGQAWYEPNVPSGSCFIVTFPTNEG